MAIVEVTIRQWACLAIHSKGGNSEIASFKILKLCWTDSRLKGNWRWGVQIWLSFWAKSTPPLSCWLLEKILKSQWVEKSVKHGPAWDCKNISQFQYLWGIHVFWVKFMFFNGTSNDVNKLNFQNCLWDTRLYFSLLNYDEWLYPMKSVTRRLSMVKTLWYSNYMTCTCGYFGPVLQVFAVLRMPCSSRMFSLGMLWTSKNILVGLDQVQNFIAKSIPFHERISQNFQFQ